MKAMVVVLVIVVGFHFTSSMSLLVCLMVDPILRTYDNPLQVSFNGKQIGLFHLGVIETLFSNIARPVTNLIDAGIV